MPGRGVLCRSRKGRQVGGHLSHRSPHWAAAGRLPLWDPLSRCQAQRALCALPSFWASLHRGLAPGTSISPTFHRRKWTRKWKVSPARPRPGSGLAGGDRSCSGPGAAPLPSSALQNPAMAPMPSRGVAPARAKLGLGAVKQVTEEPQGPRRGICLSRGAATRV